MAVLNSLKKSVWRLDYRSLVIWTLLILKSGLAVVWTQKRNHLAVDALE